ncbi:hypothetical protein [Agarilytica rhodophyticola]|uniref:hypothetical protein n=1 Tax=Agarilytica rhodophyticola TaxID=1737490 RepID=UPI000B348A07|nr:hypothetical protein [Agarilytica rhodophyticola]
MKIAITTILIAFSSVAFAQGKYLEVKQEFLSDNANFGAWEVSSQQNLLDKSLSESLKSNILQSSGPYAITNMKDIQALINNEKSKLYPDLKLSVNTFKNQKPLEISINRIDTRQQREILRGQVDGVEGSNVKLVVYNGQMSGRVTFMGKQKVLVIRSMNGGIAANYEVDTSNITFD